MPNPFDLVFGPSGGGDSNPTPGYPRGRFAPVPGESIFGVGSETARQRQGYLEADRTRAITEGQNEETRRAQADLLATFAQKKAENPGMPFVGLLTDTLSTPEGQKLFYGRGITPEFISSAGKLFQNPQTAMGEGQRLVEQQPSGEMKTLATVPKDRKTSIVVTGGDPEVAKRFPEAAGLPKDKQFEFQIGTDPATGKEYLAGIQSLDGGITIMPENRALNKDIDRAAGRKDDLMKRQGETIDLLRQADRIKKQVTEQGATGLSALGYIARAGEQALSQFHAAGKAFGFPTDETAYDFGALTRLIGTGPGSAALRANLMAFAYQIAKSKQGGVITKADIQDAIGEMGSWGSPKQLLAGLDEVTNRAVTRYNDDTVVFNASRPEGMSPVGDLGSTLDRLGLSSYRKQQHTTPPADEAGAPTEASAQAKELTPEVIQSLSPSELVQIPVQGLTPENKKALLKRLMELRNGGQGAANPQ